MKKNILLVLILCVILAFGACAAPRTTPTAIGEFELSQDTKATIDDPQGNVVEAAAGNILLVVYFTPAKDNNVTEDQAYAFFYSGTKAIVDGQAYDMKCLVFEKTGGKLRYGTVFEIPDNGYSDQKKPAFDLQIPQAVPEVTPKPTATPIPTPVATPTPDVSAEASPTVSA